MGSAVKRLFAPMTMATVASAVTITPAPAASTALVRNTTSQEGSVATTGGGVTVSIKPQVTITPAIQQTFVSSAPENLSSKDTSDGSGVTVSLTTPSQQQQEAKMAQTISSSVPSVEVKPICEGEPQEKRQRIE